MAVAADDHARMPEIDVTDPDVIRDPVSAYGDARERASVAAAHRSRVRDGDRLDEVELVTLVCISLSPARRRPTWSPAIAALLAHPEQLAAAPRRSGVAAARSRRAGPLVRPPVTDHPAYAAEDVEIEGTSIRQGGRVTVAIAAANRDPRVFADPDRLDITRTDTTPGHLGFAHGPHFSLGAPLARMRTEITLSALLTRLPDLARPVAPEEITYMPDPATWLLAALPVTL